MSTIRVYLGEDYEIEGRDPEAPAYADFYSDPSYWEDYYRDDKHDPDFYEVWPGDNQEDNDTYEMYVERDSD